MDLSGAFFQRVAMAHFLDVTLESHKGRESSESLLELFPISLSSWPSMAAPAYAMAPLFWGDSAIVPEWEFVLLYGFI